MLCRSERCDVVLLTIIPEIRASKSTFSKRSTCGSSKSGESFATNGTFVCTAAMRASKSQTFRIEKHLTVARVRARDIENQILRKRSEAFDKMHEIRRGVGALRIAREI